MSKTETLIDETKDSVISDLDKKLSEYNELEEVETEFESSDNKESEVQSNGNGVDVSALDKSDPDLYYQSGKKKGQLRPKAKKKLGIEADTTTTKKIQGNHVLNGVMLITFIDLLFPLALTVINNQFSKTKVKVNDLKIQQKQKNELAPLADEVVKMLNIEANPIHLFLISLVGIYGLNLVEARNKDV